MGRALGVVDSNIYLKALVYALITFLFAYGLTRRIFEEKQKVDLQSLASRLVDTDCRRQ